MNDLLWLTNHPLWGNVVGILIIQNPNTPKGLESQLSVKIRRILVELTHSTKLELRKLRRIQMDSGRASALELSEDSQQAGKFSGPQNLAFVSTLQRMNLGAL
jgi:hypothetical protein